MARGQNKADVFTGSRNQDLHQRCAQKVARAIVRFEQSQPRQGDHNLALRQLCWAALEKEGYPHPLQDKNSLHHATRIEQMLRRDLDKIALELRPRGRSFNELSAGERAFTALRYLGG
jgi:hypothetical protein